MPLAIPAKERLFGCIFEEKLNAIRNILKMLCQLHHQGIAHKDIKIENILMYLEHYVLSDFGLVFSNRMFNGSYNSKCICGFNADRILP